MNKLAFLASVALVASATAALAQTNAPARPDRNADVTRQQVIERTDQRFARMDVNRDGRFTPDDARQLREQRGTERANRMFERLDANRDGNVTRAEFDQSRAARQQRMAERRAQAGDAGEARGHRGPRHHGMRFHGRHHGRAMGGQRMFGEQGSVTAEQMRARALERFDRMDANHDGTLTAAERQQAREQMRAQFRQRMEERRAAQPAQ